MSQSRVVFLGEEGGEGGRREGGDRGRERNEGCCVRKLQTGLTSLCDVKIKLCFVSLGEIEQPYSLVIS